MTHFNILLQRVTPGFTLVGVSTEQTDIREGQQAARAVGKCASRLFGRRRRQQRQHAACGEGD